METARHARPPGTPSRTTVALAAAALVTVTGMALWLLPAKPTGQWDPPAAAAAVPVITARPVMAASTAPTPPDDGYVAFVDAVRSAGFDLPGTARRTGVRHFLVGHLVAGDDGCAPAWAGVAEATSSPVARRLERLRLAGGAAGLTFGGPDGDDPAVTCPSPDRLLSAYRRVLSLFSSDCLDFEIRTTSRGPTLRRATAITALQREAAGNRRSLRVTFTVPATTAGLSAGAQEMLRTTRAAGADIGAVNLLIPFAPGDPGNLRRLALTAGAAHVQLDRVFGGDSWPRTGLVPVLAGYGDLGPEEARKLSGFRIRHHLAPLSVRGITPTDEVTRILNR
ncbi:hypothetical protein J5X84_18655 [Streptosporangiaceae bacterium NEAU-GS5]|nr:hypothetical protein [Streptosporangiaceae bacterium NEAU-GS5]